MQNHPVFQNTSLTWYPLLMTRFWKSKMHEMGQRVRGSVERGFKLTRFHFAISFISGESKCKAQASLSISHYSGHSCVSRGVGWCRQYSEGRISAGGQTDWKTGQYSGWASGPVSVVAVQCVSCQQATQHSTPVHKCMYHINITQNQLSTGLYCVTDPSFIVPVGDCDDQIPTIITTASKDSFLWETRECWKLPIDVIFSSSKMSTLK